MHYDCVDSQCVVMWLCLSPVTADLKALYSVAGCALAVHNNTRFADVFSDVDLRVMEYAADLRVSSLCTFPPDVPHWYRLRVVCVGV